MTSLTKRTALAITMLAAACSGGASPPAETQSPRPVASAPRTISGRITDLGRGFDGQVGIAVRSIDDGWTAGWNAAGLYPQQSVSKLWVSITVLDAVDP